MIEVLINTLCADLPRISPSFSLAESQSHKTLQILICSCALQRLAKILSSWVEMSTAVEKWPPSFSKMWTNEIFAISSKQLPRYRKTL